MKRKTIVFVILIEFSVLAQSVLARGGGGGSGGGGGGGGGFGGGGGSGSGGPWWLNLLILIIFVVIAIAGSYIKNKQLKARERTEEKIMEAEHIDAVAIKQRVSDIFYKFQKAWSDFDLETLKTVVTDNYYKRMVLELGVLQNEHRQDRMDETRLTQTFIYDVAPNPAGGGDTVVVQISASAQDRLIDTQTKRELFCDSSPFVEFWHLIKEQGEWKLNLITQETENAAMDEKDIADFASQNGFYYDADFGWLMMPNQGVLFKQTDFGKSDINNHVIGSYRNKIVEFYTYVPNTKAGVGYKNYLIAQAILPINYKNILIKKKGWLNWGPWGLKKMQLESVDFNNKFCLWADPSDQVNSLELLTPNFMDKIYNLPFELNIEIVGGFLYFYTKDRGAANYAKMLEILSWAFDEMKM